jgi:hypothetical protein
MVELSGRWGKVKILTCLGADKKKVWTLIYLGGWGIQEGFGKRFGVEAIRGSVCLGLDLRKGW